VGRTWGRGRGRNLTERGARQREIMHYWRCSGGDRQTEGREAPKNNMLLQRASLIKPKYMEYICYRHICWISSLKCETFIWVVNREESKLL
jgi:hypothetical protein